MDKKFFRIIIEEINLQKYINLGDEPFFSCKNKHAKKTISTPMCACIYACVFVFVCVTLKILNHP